MNVLEVYTSFLPERGGVERHIYDLCWCLREKGHKPFVFAWMPPKPSIEIIDGILIRRIQIPRLFHRGVMAGYPLIFYLFLQIGLSVRKFDIHVIHAHDYLPGLASVLAGMFLRKPVFVTFHLPVQRTTYFATSRLSPSSIFEQFLKKCFIFWVSVIICVSKFTYQETVKLGFPSSKLRVIYNWITPLPKCEVDDLEDVLKRFNLKGRHFILSVGRLDDAQKGFSMLLNAFQMLIDKDHSIDLVIVGDGPDKQMLSNYALELDVMDRFHLLGHVSNRDLVYLYGGCEVFVLPSRFEGLPLTLLEAMSFGKSVVATKVGGVPEVVEDGRNGILVEPRPDALASGIEMLLMNPHLKDSFAKRSQEILTKFSMQNCYATVNLLETISKS